MSAYRGVASVLSRVFGSIALLAGCNSLSGIDAFEFAADAPPLEASGAGDSTSDKAGHGGPSGIDSQAPPPHTAPSSDGGDDSGVEELVDAGVDAGRDLHVFVTSTKSNPTFSGVAGADEICQTRASEAGRSGTWVAWISSGSTSAIPRITAAGPWSLFDGTVAVASRDELTSGTITHAINVDEKGVTEIVDDVWTGTSATGGGSSADCLGWNSFSCAGSCPTGTSGRTNVRTAGWTSNGKNACSNNSQRLYCFEN
ncbi:MAG TPA: hypothetical protein VM925_26210 [Labilithrix sp.]|nr:hypothetical protein [Labilithrix sp.]